MIVVMLMGGMGNQMFQYSFGRFLSLKYDLPLFLNKQLYDKGLSNRTFDLEIFNLDKKVLIGGDVELARCLFGKQIIRITERQFHYDEELLNEIDGQLCNTRNIVLVITGYWQSYKYITPIASNIREEFRFRRPPDGKWSAIEKQINNSASVMVNVRRGDYLQKLNYHGVVSKEYITGAICQYGKELSNATFFIFSDDIPWCRKHFSTIAELQYLDESYYDPQYEYYFQLMCACKYFVLANSSFSWWAAWLSSFPEKKIIAPTQWFTNEEIDTSDLLPADWIKYMPQL